MTLQRFFSKKWLHTINILGLALGLAVSMFLLLHLNYEYSFDRHFKDGDRVYRVLTMMQEGENKAVYPINLRSFRAQVLQDVPEVEEATQFYDEGEVLLSYGDNQSIKRRALLVDSNFLSVFPMPVVYGDPHAALSNPQQIVLTRSVAETMFGVGKDPVGEAFMREGYTVGAVIEDLPKNTHFYFDVLSYNPEVFKFQGLEYHTYIKLQKGADVEQTLEKCREVNRKLLKTRFPMEGYFFDSLTEPLFGLHLHTVSDANVVEPTDPTNLKMIIAVVILILGVAVVNFITLTLTQGESRAMEIGIRKTNGAERPRLMQMLFGETVMYALVAFVLGLLLFASCTRPLAQVLSITLPDTGSGLFGVFQGLSPAMWRNFALLFVGTTLAAGFYPAVYLSGFKPVSLMRETRKRRQHLSVASVMVQFSVVVFCVASLMIVMKQVHFVKSMPLGYNPDNVMMSSVSFRTSAYENLVSELTQYPVIHSVAISQGAPNYGYSGQLIHKMGQNERESVTINERRVGRGYFETFEVSILQGRDFSGVMEADRNSVLLSETTVRELGLGDDPVGQKVMMFGRPLEVIGVVNDVVYESARTEVGRVAYTAYNTGNWLLALRYTPGGYAQAKEAFTKLLEAHFPNEPVAIVSLKDSALGVYEKDDATLNILACGAILAILLACLGLLALSGAMTRQRTKEIGVRKVMGAENAEVVGTLLRYIILRVLPALPIGLAAAYFVMHGWLQSFVYVVNMGWVAFVVAGLGTLMIASLTVMGQSLRAATANPVEAIKTAE
jgi:ABC-type antimicrobial peptide transport system, permease component